eukprot:TRINITY_DN116624_c0_g1_i1.p1 TRINITY_DN116624_c0_g1~~TRINITY_DN116624_c0_g1_i1.p1  ORF type:complete len:354 (-),score=8.81 TRINITY_DN116624_c0_g1_i1:91-1152(-)
MSSATAGPRRQLKRGRPGYKIRDNYTDLHTRFFMAIAKGTIIYSPANILMKLEGSYQIYIQTTKYFMSDLTLDAALFPGDVIAATSESMPTAYHFAVYIGDGFVVEFASDGKPKGKGTFRKQPVASFFEHKTLPSNLVPAEAQPESSPAFTTCPKCFVLAYRTQAHPLAPGVVAARARGCLAQETAKYDVLNNNSEHFVNYCKVGRTISVLQHMMYTKERWDARTLKQLAIGASIAPLFTTSSTPSPRSQEESSSTHRTDEHRFQDLNENCKSQPPRVRLTIAQAPDNNTPVSVSDKLSCFFSNTKLSFLATSRQLCCCTVDPLKDIIEPPRSSTYQAANRTKDAGISMDSPV